MVTELLGRRQEILRIAAAHVTPFYLIDDQALRSSIRRFSEAFRSRIPDCQIYYAMKLNPHPYILRQVVVNGFGLDASSHRELVIALNMGAKKIVFTGPAKSREGLTVAVRNAKRVIVNLDGFQELEHLGSIARRSQRTVRAGVRVFTGAYSRWNKFGIPLTELKTFFEKARRHRFVDLQGIHVHMSWNRDAAPYAEALRQISSYLKKNLTNQQRTQIRFIDFGGGFRPYRGEGYYPATTDQGEIIEIVSRYLHTSVRYRHRYFLVKSVPIEQYAEGIGQAITRYLRPLGEFAYFTEPGRIICNQAMHIVLRIADIKPQGIIIADGGNNLIGWERFEYYYFPLINLTHPSATQEKKALIYGNLCLLEDIWGHYCYAKKFAVGDVLLVPYQGAMAYTLAQQFIHPIPPVYHLR